MASGLCLLTLSTLFAGIGRPSTPARERTDLRAWTPHDVWCNARHGLMTGAHRLTGQPPWRVRTSTEVLVPVISWTHGRTVGAGTLVLALEPGPLKQSLLRRTTAPTVRSSCSTSPICERASPGGGPSRRWPWSTRRPCSSRQTSLEMAGRCAHSCPHTNGGIPGQATRHGGQWGDSSE